MAELRESGGEANICHRHHVTHEIFIAAQAAALPRPQREEPEDGNKEPTGGGGTPMGAGQEVASKRRQMKFKLGEDASPPSGFVLRRAAEQHQSGDEPPTGGGGRGQRVQDSGGISAQRDAFWAPTSLQKSVIFARQLASRRAAPFQRRNFKAGGHLSSAVF